MQPLWLELIDYLWMGILNPVVLSGSGVTLREIRGGRSTGEIRVTLVKPVVVLPGGLMDPGHIALRPSAVRFGTWTGGVNDR